MPPIISIVGRKKSGKTTFLEKIISEIRMRGYKVAAIKHNVHGFDIDHKGKDSWRLKRAGACTVILSSPKKVAIVKDVPDDQPLDVLASRYLEDADIILTEGYRKQDKPKIEIYRKDSQQELLCKGDGQLIAIVGDVAFDTRVPCFDPKDAQKIVDWLEEKFLKKVRHS
ncbi:MAG TPA: molybdopterin-guanine dinucleotide biosynthesis protein B [Syntrophaceae bacterium]|nr:molybdopterin-guanine dinucleotide biosynthesis protein B [Syntrophaceae bacterium]